MYALIDGNNFYCSCERLFQPELRKRPVVVLSNNDGCIIARSDESKACGIPMGAPLFKYRALIRRHNIALRSPNFALYGEVSRRMMSTIATLAPTIEPYSIDEAFIDLQGIVHTELVSLAEDIRHRVLRWVGIPTSIGIAPTKTLAKLANHVAKRSRQTILLSRPSDRQAAFDACALSDVWGIGRRLQRTLANIGITTIDQFMRADRARIRRHLGVVGVQIWMELHGYPVLQMNMPMPRKSLSFSRTFAHPITERPHLEETLASFIATCAAKMREEGSMTSLMHLFIATNRYRLDMPQHFGNEAIQLTEPTADTARLVAYMHRTLRRMWRAGMHYKRAGVILSNLISRTAYQRPLFNATPDSHQLYRAIDALNRRYGRSTLILGAEGLDEHRRWAPHREQLANIGSGPFWHFTISC